MVVMPANDENMDDIIKKLEDYGYEKLANKSVLKDLIKNRRLWIEYTESNRIRNVVILSRRSDGNLFIKFSINYNLNNVISELCKTFDNPNGLVNNPIKISLKVASKDIEEVTNLLKEELVEKCTKDTNNYYILGCTLSKRDTQ